MSLEVPDRGWAWMIAFSACIINMLLSGLSRMIGILYVAVLEEYDVTRQEATIPFAVRNSIRMLSGPLVGIIGQSYGIRTVTFCGGLLAAAGAALCCIAPNVTWLTVFWGGLHGVGFAFANTLFQVVVNQYFEKHRATASGIALSGACVGSLAFPIMIELILEHYGLSGGFLILGGVVMHVLPPALMLKSPPWVEDPEKYSRQRAYEKAKKEKQKDSTDTLNSVTPIVLKQEKVDKFNDKKRMARARSLSCNPCEELVYNINVNHLEDTKGIFTHMHCDESWQPKEELKAVCFLYKIKRSPCMLRKMAHQIDAHPDDYIRKSSVPTISGQVIKENGANSSSDENKTKGRQDRQTLSESLKSIVALYKNPVYLLISICMSTYVITFIPILTVIVDYSLDKDISEEYGKYLINAMAIGDLFGRLGFGWVTDRGIMSIPSFMTTMLVMQGIVISLFPLALNLYTFMATLFLYGMAAGSMLVLFPVLVLKYVEFHEQSVGMACVGFLSGIMSFSIPPLIGHFRDTVGSYDGMFYLTGGISVISGAMWLVEPVLVKYYYGENFEDELNKKTFFNNIEANKEEESKPR